MTSRPYIFLSVVNNYNSTDQVNGNIYYFQLATVTMNENIHKKKKIYIALEDNNRVGGDVMQ